METKAERVGVFGGTFNPVHHGHLLLARDALESLGLSRVILVPNRMSPLRVGETLAPASVRLEMLRAAVRGEDRLEVSDLEIRREGPSYTVETLREFSGLLPGARLVFLAGADSLATLDRWVRVDEIFTLAEVVVLPRPGEDVPAALAGLAARAPDIARQVRLAPVTRGIDLSATEIRNRVSRGLSIRWMVPGHVERLVKEHALYRDP